MVRAGVATGLVALMMTAGCASRDAAPDAEMEPVDDGRRLVLSITDVDVGRTFDGILVTARGETETAGWSAAMLRPRAADLTLDIGVLAFDLVARPPATAPTGALAALPAARRVETALPLSLQALQGVSELRVHSQTNAAAVSFR